MPRSEVKSDETELLIWGVPKELKLRFKVRCLERDISMTKAIIRFMERFTQKENTNNAGPTSPSPQVPPASPVKRPKV